MTTTCMSMSPPRDALSDAIFGFEPVEENRVAGASKGPVVFVEVGHRVGERHHQRLAVEVHTHQQGVCAGEPGVDAHQVGNANRHYISLLQTHSLLSRAPA